MDERRHGGRGENAREHRGMILMRMHTARRHQAHDVAAAAGLPQAFDQALECRRTCDIAAGDRRVDAGQILQHETAGADVEMSDLGIAHLPLRQANILARSSQQGVRAGRPQLVEAGSARLANSVVSRLFAPTPAIKHDQHYRTTLLHVSMSSAPRQRW